MELIVATRNKDKCKELQALLQDLGVRLRTIGDFPGAPDVVEDGSTCEANAIKKARSAMEYTRLPAIADDTALEVAVLDGRPGVYAARYAGESATYEDNWRKLLHELNGVHRARRQARFVTAAAIAYPDGRVQVALGTLDGVITEEPKGASGFGYDPVFLVPEMGKTLAEMTPEEKNQVSHRARAFHRAKELLQVGEAVK
ncbi:MAG: XTP/dITP diphosphatase [Nitrospiraceae bacterium]